MYPVRSPSKRLKFRPKRNFRNLAKHGKRCTAPCCQVERGLKTHRPSRKLVSKSLQVYDQPVVCINQLDDQVLQTLLGHGSVDVSRVSLPDQGYRDRAESITYHVASAKSNVYVENRKAQFPKKGVARVCKRLFENGPKNVGCPSNMGFYFKQVRVVLQDILQDPEISGDNGSTLGESSRRLLGSCREFDDSSPMHDWRIQKNENNEYVIVVSDESENESCLLHERSLLEGKKKPPTKGSALNTNVNSRSRRKQKLVVTENGEKSLIVDKQTKKVLADSLVNSVRTSRNEFSTSSRSARYPRPGHHRVVSRKAGSGNDLGEEILKATRRTKVVGKKKIPNPLNFSFEQDTGSDLVQSRLRSSRVIAGGSVLTDPEAAGTAVQRKRGRAKKEVQHGSLVADAAKDQIVKRKRGRPRKVTDDEDDGVLGDDEATIASLKEASSILFKNLQKTLGNISGLFSSESETRKIVPEFDYVNLSDVSSVSSVSSSDELYEVLMKIEGPREQVTPKWMNDPDKEAKFSPENSHDLEKRSSKIELHTGVEGSAENGNHYESNPEDSREASFHSVSGRYSIKQEGTDDSSSEETNADESAILIQHDEVSITAQEAQNDESKQSSLERNDGQNEEYSFLISVERSNNDQESADAQAAGNENSPQSGETSESERVISEGESVTEVTNPELSSQIPAEENSQESYHNPSLIASPKSSARPVINSSDEEVTCDQESPAVQRTLNFSRDGGCPENEEGAISEIEFVEDLAPPEQSIAVPDDENSPKESFHNSLLTASSPSTPIGDEGPLNTTVDESVIVDQESTGVQPNLDFSRNGGFQESESISQGESAAHVASPKHISPVPADDYSSDKSSYNDSVIVNIPSTPESNVAAPMDTSVDEELTYDDDLESVTHSFNTHTPKKVNLELLSSPTKSISGSHNEKFSDLVIDENDDASLNSTSDEDEPERLAEEPGPDREGIIYISTDDEMKSPTVQTTQSWEPKRTSKKRPSGGFIRRKLMDELKKSDHMKYDDSPELHAVGDPELDGESQGLANHVIVNQPSEPIMVVSDQYTTEPAPCSGDVLALTNASTADYFENVNPSCNVRSDCIYSGRGMRSIGEPQNEEVSNPGPSLGVHSNAVPVASHGSIDSQFNGQFITNYNQSDVGSQLVPGTVAGGYFSAAGVPYTNVTPEPSSANSYPFPDSVGMTPRYVPATYPAYNANPPVHSVEFNNSFLVSHQETIPQGSVSNVGYHDPSSGTLYLLVMPPNSDAPPYQ